ncbi:MAG TPA: S8 family serine peptidase [Intrasporangium sp.]|nr:S8 family serine peptidase [Intrasporangium sp.]
MRPNWRVAVGAATAAAVATCMTATTALGQADVTSSRGKPPIVGGRTPSGAPTSNAVTVTLITGDRVLVSGAGSDRPSATVLPRDDGTVPLVETRRVGKNLYVYPSDAAEALSADRVDEELFNVTGLVAQGYDDAGTKTLPVIARYGAKVDVAKAAPTTPRGASRTRTLKSVKAVALKADKKQAKEFWSDVTSRTSPAGSKLEKLWLDRRLSASLDRSTAQVGAPQAWANGLTGAGTKVAVLDTGADDEHPDLKGRIVGSEDFTGSWGGALDDVDGHGTHTASTVGGSGAASDGSKKGVAPGTDLLIGKVLDDSGFGAESWIIAGMEWAAGQGADVVSMSLGSSGPPGDCTDPIATAAQQLSTTTASLFVIAAGNTGPANDTVSSPACAPAALSVGAVDRSDETAVFSSRGPAAFTHTLKPEIAAPGVGISAARSGGRGADAYVAMSGTSMATPHVAGAAAILKQANPGLTGAQLKQLLVSSAEDAIPGDVRETGAGRLDIPAALAERVTTPAIQAGTFAWPHTADQATTVDVPYTNTSDRPVTLSLKLDAVTGDDGSALKWSPVSLKSGSVTIPAGGTVKIPLAVDPAVKLTAAQYGDITGRILATGDAAVSTPFALHIAPETVELTIRMTDRNGAPADWSSSVDVVNIDSTTGERRYNDGLEELTFAVRPGRYLLSGFVRTSDQDGDNLLDSIAYFARPELTVTGDLTVDFDARTAHRLDTKTDRPSEARASVLGFTRTWDDFWIHAGTMTGGSTVTGLYADVQGKAKDGTWEFGSYTRRYAPAVESMVVTGGPTLHPAAPNWTIAGLDGTGTAPLVDAGTGTAGELTATKVKDKVALVRVPAEGNLTAQMANLARAAGVKALLLYRTAPGRWTPSTGFQAVPVAAYAIPMAEGTQLASLLASTPGNELSLTWKATAKSPYVYNLAHTETTPVTDDRTYVVHDSKLGRTESTYGSMGVSAPFLDYAETALPSGLVVGVSNFEAVPAPGARTELYTDGGAEWRQFMISSFPFGEAMLGTYHRYPAGSTRTESWYDGVIAPTAIQDDAGTVQLTAERQGGLMGFAPQMWGDSYGHVASPGSFGDIGSLELKRNGEVLGTSAWTSGVFEVPAEDSLYELTLRQFKIGPASANWKRSNPVTTTWAFRSQLEPDVFSRGLPLLFPRVDLPEDGLKTLAPEAGQTLDVRLTGHAGYTPGDIAELKVATSYDGGTTWTDAVVGDGGTVTVDHTGASGKAVTLRLEATDSKGAKVTQVVTNAYAVR